jgi:hypothetical protein
MPYTLFKYPYIIFSGIFGNLRLGEFELFSDKNSYGGEISKVTIVR